MYSFRSLVYTLQQKFHWNQKSKFLEIKPFITTPWTIFCCFFFTGNSQNTIFGGLAFLKASCLKKKKMIKYIYADFDKIIIVFFTVSILKYWVIVKSKNISSRYVQNSLVRGLGHRQETTWFRNRYFYSQFIPKWVYPWKTQPWIFNSTRKYFLYILYVRK